MRPDDFDLDQYLRRDRARPLVFASVGSDHHRFDRLVTWLDAWCRDHDVDCVIQYGTATPPRHALGVAYLDRDLLLRAMHAADVVVVQGGPMSIVEARREGSRPVVVPRVPELREVVDQHQVTFCRKLAEQGLILLAEAEQSLRSHLDQALTDPASTTVTGAADDSSISEAIERFGRVADAVAKDDPGRPKPSVLLLGGAGRSGSTLLERILGETSGAATLGETVHLWERGLRDDELCGCGRSFSACPFWSEVGRLAYGGWHTLDREEVVALRHDVVRSRHSLELLGPAWRVGWRLRRDRLARHLSALYSAAAEVSGADVLVDSSKLPAYAMLLRRVRVDLRCVLVVRDPRAVAHAWSRSVRRPEIVDRPVDMPRYGFVYSSIVWQAYALLYQVLRLARVPLLVVRYEDLVRDPAGVVGSVLSFAGLPAASASPLLEAGEVDLSSGHTVAGNPMRFTTGRAVIRSDDRWRTEMRRRDAWAVGFMTIWGRWLLGYR